MAKGIRAAFVRGGTSKGLIFRIEDLPPNRSDWDQIFLQAMGSPDPHGRQLDGMGGGISSLSKVCVVGPSTHPEADVDYLFAQVQVQHAAVDYGANCGNMSSAIGPFAVDEGIVEVADGDVEVRIHNVNTGKIIRSVFEVRDGRSLENGDCTISGVTGTGAPIRLDFLDPGGAATGRLLPTGQVLDQVKVAEETLPASFVDAANPCAFFRAEDFGLSGVELPEQLEAAGGLLTRLEDARCRASTAMGIAPSYEDARMNRTVPFLALVAPPQSYLTLSGEQVRGEEIDLLVRFISSGRPHRAIPVTGGLCTAIASSLTGSTVAEAASKAGSESFVRLGTPSGIFTAQAAVAQDSGQYFAQYASIVRTTRRLFDGAVYIPR